MCHWVCGLSLLPKVPDLHPAIRTMQRPVRMQQFVLATAHNVEACGIDSAIDEKLRHSLCTCPGQIAIVIGEPEASVWPTIAKRKSDN